MLNNFGQQEHIQTNEVGVAWARTSGNNETHDDLVVDKVDKLSWKRNLSVLKQYLGVDCLGHQEVKKRNNCEKNY